MIIVSIGAVVGSFLHIWFVDHLSRKKLQFYGFLLLAGIFFILGAVLCSINNSPFAPSFTTIAVCYAIAQFLFNLGIALRAVVNDSVEKPTVFNTGSQWSDIHGEPHGLS